MRILRIAAGFLIMTVVVAGCTSERNGTPVDGPNKRETSQKSGENPSTSVSPSDGETYGAPRVSATLDATKFLPKPCEALSPVQLKVFGVSKPGEPTTTGAVAENAGPFCTWHADSAVDSTIGVGFLTGNKKGLSDTYRGRSRFKFFEETTVDGYPAVFNDLSDGRPDGQCNITVGISDTLAFRAREEGGLVGQAVCDRAKQVAAAVIATLKAGA